MPGTNYTTNLRLANPSLNDTGWGTTVSNGMIDLTDQAIAGQASVDVSGAGPFVLTMPDGTSGDARNMFLRFTGNPGVAREVRVPTNRKLYFVTNDSDGAVTVKVSGQTGVAVPVGASMALRINAAGTDVVQALTHQASLTLGTALAATSGGTGQSSYAVGDLLYASSTTALAKLAGVATGNALLSGGVGVAPAWGKIGLTTHVSGTLPVDNGGTGATTLTGYVKGNGTGAMTASATVPVADLTGTLPVANGGTGAATLAANNVLLGNGTSAVQAVAPGTSGNVLTSNGTTWTSAAALGVNAQVYTSGTGNFTIPAGVTRLKVTVVGGGGGSAGSVSGNTGGAGGGGGAAIKWLTGLTPGNTLSYSVGTGGTAGTSAPGNGGAGGNSTVATGTTGTPQTITTITGSGGGAGLVGGSGGAGGGGTNGDLNVPGGSLGGYGVGGGSLYASTSPYGSLGSALYGGGASAAPSASGPGAAGATGVVIFEW